MQPSSPIFMDRFRKVLIFIGIGFFIFFTYKAAHDVSNTAIAAGARRTPNMPIVAGYQPIMHNFGDYGIDSLATQVSDITAKTSHQLNHHETSQESKSNNKPDTKPLTLEADDVTRPAELSQKLKKPI